MPIHEAYIGLTTISPPAMYVSSSDVLLMSYDNTNFKFYVNNIIVASHPLTLTQPMSLHFSGFINTDVVTSIKEPAILDIQMGVYNTQTTFDIMLGGGESSQDEELTRQREQEAGGRSTQGEDRKKKKISHKKKR
jgi:hypothetical protein